MAREKTESENDSKQFYKLSKLAIENGLRESFVDGRYIEILPKTDLVRLAADGRKFPDQTIPAVGIVRDASREEISRTENGFTNLTPAQVYQLVSCGMVVLSNSRPEHKKIFLGYLKDNCTTSSGEDY